MSIPTKAQLLKAIEEANNKIDHLESQNNVLQQQRYQHKKDMDMLEKKRVASEEILYKQLAETYRHLLDKLIEGICSMNRYGNDESKNEFL